MARSAKPLVIIQSVVALGLAGGVVILALMGNQHKDRIDAEVAKVADGEGRLVKLQAQYADAQRERGEALGALTQTRKDLKEQEDRLRSLAALMDAHGARLEQAASMAERLGALLAEKRKLDQAFEELRRSSADQIAQLQTQLTKEQTRANEAVAASVERDVAINAIQGERDRARRERDENRKLADDLKSEATRLAKERAELAGNLDARQRELDKALKRIDDLVRAEAARAAAAASQAATAASSPASSARPASATQPATNASQRRPEIALIHEVNENRDGSAMVKINVGTQQGLRKGGKVDLFRGQRRIGEGEVVDVGQVGATVKVLTPGLDVLATDTVHFTRE